MRTIAAGLVAAIVLVAGSTLGVPQVDTPQEGTVVGNPTISAAATDTNVSWGAGQTIEVTLANDGTLVRGGPERFEERVTTARSLRVELARDRLERRVANRLTVRGEPVLLGRLARGEARGLELDVDVGSTLSPGTYDLPLRVTYDHDGFVRYGDGEAEYNERSPSTVLVVPLTVESRPRIEVAVAEATAPIRAGSLTTYAFTVTNTGTEPATDVGVRIDLDAPLYVESPAGVRERTSVFFDRLEPGASQTVAITVGADSAATANTYLAEVTAYYRTPEGFERTNDRLRLGVPVVASTEE